MQLKLSRPMKLSLSQKTGKRLILNGCTTFKTGVYQDKYGGDIEFQLGMTIMGTYMWVYQKKM